MNTTLQCLSRSRLAEGLPRTAAPDLEGAARYYGGEGEGRSGAVRRYPPDLICSSKGRGIGGEEEEQMEEERR